MSFLITAPETGADSILVTNAFFGFIPAVVRPVISFITAVVAGIFCIASLETATTRPRSTTTMTTITITIMTTGTITITTTIMTTGTSR